jgi:hypothetical protein
MFVKFNVRGTIFVAKTEDIMKCPETYLAKLIKNDKDNVIPIDKIDDAIYINRDPKYFNIILDIYSGNNVDTKVGDSDVTEELDFYGIDYVKNEGIVTNVYYFGYYTSSHNMCIQNFSKLLHELKEYKNTHLYFVPLLLCNPPSLSASVGRFYSHDKLYEYFPFLNKYDIKNIFGTGFTLSSQNKSGFDEKKEKLHKYKYYINHIIQSTQNIISHNLLHNINYIIAHNISKLLVKYPEREQIYITKP